MSKIRPKKLGDKENVEKGYKLILNLMENHPEIEPTLWAGALFSTIVDGYINSHISYVSFCEELDNVKEFYKIWWDKENE